jgi:hypothetical protein
MLLCLDLFHNKTYPVYLFFVTEKVFPILIMKYKSTNVIAAIFVASTSLSMGAINVYLSPNDIQTAEASGIAGVTTENFTAAPLGTVNSYAGALGTYTTTTTASVLANDQYGGNAEGNYLGVAANSSTTLPFTIGDVQYFGLYFTAGNDDNIVQLYDNGALVFSFNTASLNTILNNGAGTIQAINGSIYNTADYFGQPVTNNNNSEPYAYLHFIASAGSKFDEVRLSNISDVFENDNHSLRAIAPEVPGTLVSIPEPSSALLGLLGVTALGLRRRRR